jgi:hypothetical protein
VLHRRRAAQVLWVLGRARGLLTLHDQYRPSRSPPLMRGETWFTQLMFAPPLRVEVVCVWAPGGLGLGPREDLILSASGPVLTAAAQPAGEGPNAMGP